MLSTPPPSNDLNALLSVASAAGLNTLNNGLLSEFGGKSLLEWQIHALQSCGVRSFLLEVDNVSGSLLALIDNLRDTGLRIEFVRHARDLSGYLLPGSRLIVQAEAHYFAPSLLNKLIAQDTPFLATLDGRDENSTFERIDLNTRWAGLGVIDTTNMASLADLPEGWSLTSLLLRHAIQTGTGFLAISQTHVHKFEVAVIANSVDAAMLTTQLLLSRRDAVTGLVEKNIFAPLAAVLASSIWRSPISVSALAGLPYVLASIGVVCAVLGWKSAALLALFASTGARTIDRVVMGTDIVPRDRPWQSYIFWGLILMTISSIVWLERYVGFDALVSVAMVTGLFLLAHHIARPGWPQQLLLSPALLIAALLFLSIFSALSDSIKFIALVQLAVLLASQYISVSHVKNNNQA